MLLVLVKIIYKDQKKNDYKALKEPHNYYKISAPNKKTLPQPVPPHMALAPILAIEIKC